jgi:antirestriction protein
MRVYVGTYHKYNSGSIAGKWLDLDYYRAADEFYEACKELHSDEQDPELMFQDWEGIPDRLAGECMDMAKVYEYREKLEQVDDADAFEAFVDHYGEYDVDAFNEAYQGDWYSEEHFAEHLADELGYYRAMEQAGMSSHYFNAEAFARDLFMGDYYFDNGYVFRAI